jgi:uncharacterized protein with NAD-binding domain and iron-sulfur cluster
MTPALERTRRELLRDGAFVAAAAAVPLPARRVRRRSRRRVAVIGGGVAGLTAAHELAERGFQVTVYEARAFGGKARSYGVPGSASGGRRELPGEHGARILPGLYVNLPDTMRRIPFGRAADGTWSNVVRANQDQYARTGGREEFDLNLALRDSHPWSVEAFRQTLVGLLETRIPPQEAAWFVERLIVFMSSGDARRFGQWERMSWYEFVDAARFSEDYRKLLVSVATRFLLGSKASEASARTLGLLWEAGFYTEMGRQPNGDFDQVLSLPTNEAWIGPWVRHLRSRLGVRLLSGARVTGLGLRGGRVTAAYADDHRIEADWFVLAVPVERARRLLDTRFRRVDARFDGLDALQTRWMNGLQFFLSREVPIVRGHVVYVDSPWALSSISQAQFWERRNFIRDYGHGNARECLSVDIADFSQPGMFNRRPASELGRRAIAHEAWAQMKAHLNDTGREVLRDSDVVRRYLDPGLVRHHGHWTNHDPLFIATPNAWKHRPGVRTAVPNLVLAGDYVNVSVDTACMEGANEAGRRAANAVLDAADSAATPASVRALYRPPEWEPLRRADELAWARGQRNAFDAPAPPG